MASLKDLRNRIASVKSTQKITSAMKMVAASKLRRAQEQAEAGRPYAERMERMLASLAAGMNTAAGQGPKLMTGTGKDDVHLVIVMTSDRGLCGGFNGSIVRDARRQIRQLLDAGKEVKILVVGRKGYDMLKREHANRIVDRVFVPSAGPAAGLRRSGQAGRNTVLKMFCYARRVRRLQPMKSYKHGFQVPAISQIVTTQQLISRWACRSWRRATPAQPATAGGKRRLTRFEPDEGKQ